MAAICEHPPIAANDAEEWSKDPIARTLSFSSAWACFGTAHPTYWDNAITAGRNFFTLFVIPTLSRSANTGSR